MAAITIPPTSPILALLAAPYEPPRLTDFQRLAILVEARIVLLNFKGGTNYIGTHRQLMQDAITAFKGMTPEQWGYALGKGGMNNDPGAVLVAAYVQQANFHDSTNMPGTVALILAKLGEQITRPMEMLVLQNTYLTYLLLSYV